MTNTPEINKFDKYYILEGFRWPVTRDLQSIMEDMTKVDYDKNWKLKSTYFPDNAILAHSIDMYTSKAEEKGMTFFHALSTEPRLFKHKGLEVQRVEWTGAYFKEAAKWGEEEITKLGSLKETVQKSKVLEEVAEAIVHMDKRMRRRQEWLAAEILTKGTLTIDPTVADNPEGLSYKVDYRLAEANIVLTPEQKWNHKDAEGNFDADIVKFFWDLAQSRTVNGAPHLDKWRRYLPTKLLMNQATYRVLAMNKKIYEYLRQTSPNRQDTTDFNPMLMFGQFKEIFQNFTGLEIEVYDEGFYDDKGVFRKFIPDGHVTVFNSGDNGLGEFTYTAHAHGGGEGKGIVVGTGRFLMAEDMTHKANPFYQIVHGFHGLPRLTDYENDFLNYRIQFMQVF